MKIASINIYVGNSQPEKDIAFIKSLDLDAIGFQEAHAVTDKLERGLDNHAILWGRGGGKPAREVTAALNTNDHNLIGSYGEEVSSVEPKDETMVFKDRWITVVKFEEKKSRRKYALLNYHGNAAIQDDNGNLLTNVKRVYQWLRAARTIQKTIKGLQKNGYRVFVTGDFNYRRFNTKGFVLNYWSPQRIFNRCNLNFAESGLDYVAWPKIMRRKRQYLIPTTRTGADHPWVVVELY